MNGNKKKVNIEIHKMKNKKTAYAMSHQDFDIMCATNHWDDSNVEELTDRAFISIVSSDECQKYYHEEDEEHWFKKDHPNVLNLAFDDITEDMVYNGHQFSAMTMDQAKKIFDFIENNIGKNFSIHCRAGISRSGAICCFILQMYEDMYIQSFSEMRRMRPNNHVLTALKRLYYEKYRMY